MRKPAYVCNRLGKSEAEQVRAGLTKIKQD
jgi:hypothetical protein